MIKPKASQNMIFETHKVVCHDWQRRDTDSNRGYFDTAEAGRQYAWSFVTCAQEMVSQLIRYGFMALHGLGVASRRRKKKGRKRSAKRHRRGSKWLQDRGVAMMVCMMVV